MVCENCSIEHEGSYASGRFCSQKCSRSFATRTCRKQISQKTSETLTSKGRTCTTCKKKFVKELDGWRGQFCQECSSSCVGCKQPLSNACIQVGFRTCESCKILRRRGVTPEQKFQGLRYVDVCPFEHLWNNEARKKRIFSEDGRFCSKCKLSVWNDLLIPLELDHIDGDKTNNLRSNCRILCPNCHAQTPTYRWRNRVDRRKNNSSTRN